MTTPALGPRARAPYFNPAARPADAPWDMTGFRTGVRRLAAVAITACWLGAPPALAQADPAGPVAGEPAQSAVAVFSPRAPALLRAVDGGVRVFMVQELRRSGVPVVAPAHTDAVAERHLGAEHLFLRGTDARALASEAEAGAVLLSQLSVADGKLEIWVRAYDGSGTAIAVGHGHGRVTELGEALVTALRPVLAALATSPEAEVAPQLAELAAYERAQEQLTAGELASA